MSDVNALTLKVGGQIFGGWTSVSIRTGIEQLAGIFELGVTERWPDQPSDWNIPPGERGEVLIGDDTVITGYVDSVGVSFDDKTHDIKVTGRDAAGDLVDCSAASTAFSNLTFLQIAEKLCTPFGIAVYDETDLGKKLTLKEKKAGKHSKTPKARRLGKKLPKMAVQNGESVFKTLEKLARSEGVLLVSDSEGGLVITRAGLGGDATTVLELGKNVKRGSLDHSYANLFSEITVKGQAAAAAAGKYGVVEAQPKATITRAKTVKASNTEIARYRPLILVAETQADASRCKQRAEWEASNREAKSRRVSITVQGWRQEDGTLWRINQRVRIVCAWMRIDEWLLIAGVHYLLDENGTQAELTLTSDKAFDLLPEIPMPTAGAAAGKYKVVSR